MIVYGYKSPDSLYVWNPNNQTRKTYGSYQFFRNGKFYISGYFLYPTRRDGANCPVVYDPS